MAEAVDPNCNPLRREALTDALHGPKALNGHLIRFQADLRAKLPIDKLTLSE